MKRPWHVWAIFALCLAVVSATMAWLSLAVLRLERAEAAARRQAAVEENVRLALWRMDSALATLIAQESARPYFLYSSFYPAERAYTRMFAEIEFGEVLVPSPLLTQVSPYILLHFQIDEAGQITSPQVPDDELRALAVPRFATDAQVAAAAKRLAELRHLVQRDALIPSLPLESAPPSALVRAPRLPAGRDTQTQQEDVAAGPQAAQQQLRRSLMETEARNRAVQQSNTLDFNVGNERLWSGEVTTGPLQPRWVGQTLLLARRAAVNGREYVQGCSLDWPAIQEWLCAEIADLFPHGRLEPHGVAAASDGGRVLAALPVHFVPGAPLVAADAPRSPLRVSLLIAWGCALLAVIAVAALLVGTLALSERRAAFVSAVTHELRTPLTTFQLYTEMLTEGLVPDQAKRQDYLQTLQAEAGRLSHLVENVLAYARLERGQAGGHVEVVRIPDVLARSEHRLSARARQADMDLIIHPAQEAAAAASVRADPLAVEQILLNLVDNACKYATTAAVKQIEVSAAVDDRVGVIAVRDHGPGIPPAHARRLFRLFHKSAGDAAHSAPGVGLGLALSRRLARAMHGDLVLADCPGGGACLELRLPLA